MSDLDRHATFAELLARVKYNISRTSLPRHAALVQLRQQYAGINLAVTYTTESWGPTYYVYPGSLTTNLINHWTLASFETASGTGGVRPSVGTVTGTINGGPTTSTFDDLVKNGGRRRYFTVFDGDGDFINLGDITSFDGEASISIGFRLRPDSIDSSQDRVFPYSFPISFDNADGVIISRWPASDTNKQFYISALENGAIRAVFSTDATGGRAWGLTSSAQLATDTWDDVLVVYNGGGSANADRLQIYVEGASQTLTFNGTIPTSLRAVSGDVLIGRRENDTTDDYAGDLYDLAYWSTNLSSAQAATWDADSITDRIIAGTWKIAGDLDTYNTATTRTMMPAKTNRSIRKAPMDHRQLATLIS
jgi:hypothetical protein